MKPRNLTDNNICLSHRIIDSFPPLRADKTGFNRIIFILILVENCLQFDAVNKFSADSKSLKKSYCIIGYFDLLKGVFHLSNLIILF